MRNRSNKNPFAGRLHESRRLNEDGITSLYRLFPDMEQRDKQHIDSIALVPTNARQCRVTSDGQHVYAAARFYPGDIIEACPVKEISMASLASRDVREMAFEVEWNKEYVIPMGYCQFYDIIDGFNTKPNCDWEWDAKKKTIIIRALTKIQKGTRLILNINE